MFAKVVFVMQCKSLMSFNQLFIFTIELPVDAHLHSREWNFYIKIKIDYPIVDQINTIRVKAELSHLSQTILLQCHISGHDDLFKQEYSYPLAHIVVLVLRDPSLNSFFPIFTNAIDN